MNNELGQLYLVGFDGQEYNRELDVFLEEYGVGSFILFEKNIPDSRDKLKKLIKDINDKSESLSLPKPIIALDHEGGRVHRMRDLATRFPALGHTSSLPDDKIIEIAYQQAQELLYYGFNTIMAPVLDLCDKDAPGVIGARSLSASPDEVARRSLLVMEGFRQAGIIAVPKHFPGHGDIPADPHFGMAVVEKRMEEFEESDIIPFKAVIDNGADIIMSAHILTPAVDGEMPATLSRFWLNYLRTKLGFANVIMADDLCMKAIWDNYTMEEITARAITAGIDLFCVCFNNGEFSTGFNRSYDCYQKLIADDPEYEKLFNASLQRMQKLKAPLSSLQKVDDEAIFKKGLELKKIVE